MTDAFVAARTSDQDAEVAVTKSLEPYRDAAPGLVGGTRPDGLAHRSGDVPGAVPQGAVAILAGRIMDWGDGDGRPALNSEVAHELAYYLTEVGAVPQEEVVPKVSEEVWMARLSKLVRDDLKSLQEPLPQGVHASDCAVHNEPAYPNGPCNCGAEIIVTAEMIASAFAWEKSGSAVVSDEFYFAALYRAMAAVAPQKIVKPEMTPSEGFAAIRASGIFRGVSVENRDLMPGSEPTATDLPRQQREIGKRIPLRDKDLAMIVAFNRKLGVDYLAMKAEHDAARLRLDGELESHRKTCEECMDAEAALEIARAELNALRSALTATESPEAADAVSPVGKARDTIQNLRAGVIPRQLVRDLGDAVERAKQDLAVGGMKG